MKILSVQTFLAFLLASIVYAHGLNGQGILDTEISVKLEDTSLKKALLKIERAAGVKFTYSPSVINESQKVSVDASNQKLSELLEELLGPINISYKLIADRISLYKVSDSASPSEVQAGNAQVVILTVTGAVTDDNSQPLPGVNVIEKGTTNGTATDADGKFSLNVQNENSVLVFSFIGYTSQEVAVNGRTTIDVTMAEDVQRLDEIVVVGYSSQAKKDITGAVAIVEMKALKSIPAGSAVQALQGQASGVNVISSGAPGRGSNIFIRGIGSFGNTQPLILVDGIQADLNNISADDIESIQVLKDAGAAAIYGVRGSNGVIVVTTKKGKSGQPTLTYDAYYGIQSLLPGDPFNKLNSQDFARLYNVANPGNILFKDGLPDFMYAGPGVIGTAMAGDPAVDPSKYNLDPQDIASNYLIQEVNKSGTDWYRAAFKNAPIQNHSLTASGGTDKSNYLFSLGYFNQQGTLIGTFLKRYSAKINTEFKLRKNIRIGQNAYIFYKENPANDGSFAVSTIYRAMPIIPVYDIKGNFGGTFAGPELGSGRNVVAEQKRTVNNRNNVWDVVGNVYAEIDFLDHFTARTSFGGTIDNQYHLGFVFNGYNNAFFNFNKNGLTETALYNNTSMWTNTLKYSNLFDKHHLVILAGSEAIKNSGRSVRGSSNSFFSTDFDYLVLGNGTSDVTNSSNAYLNTLFSLFSRLDYAYDDKYLLGVTIRRDGSSLFGSEKRFGIFPSVSLGWRVSDEGFMQNLNWVNDLKIRGSYGILGSQNNVNPANAFTLYGGGFGNAYYDITGSGNSIRQGFFQTRNGNPSTGWEQNIVSNFGFDVTMLNNNVDVSVEYYKKSIDGLLFPLPLPSTAGGAAAPTVNIGDIQNTGFDVSAAYRGNINNNLQFTIRTNITTYKNLVVDIPNPGYFDVSASTIGNLVRNQEGQPVSSFFGYEVIDLFRDDADVSSSPTQIEAAPGRFKYRDVNGDGEITPDDRTFFGHPNPDFTYGLNLGLNYKGFDFSTVFYGSQGNEVLNHMRFWTDFFGSYPGGKSNVLLNAWTPENTNTKIPKVESANSFSTSGAPNSYYMEDGSYLRLRSIILGYTVNPSVLQKYGVSKLRLYMQSANLFTITKYTGLDPELGGNSANFGIDYGNYPNNQQNFLFGLNVAF